MVTMREGEAARYNLGWHRIDVKRAATELCYVLVPADLDQIIGFVPLQRIRWNGAPEAPLHATAVNLASARLRDDTEGQSHPLEIKLIQILRERAEQAGHSLPEIVPSLRFRDWSRMELSPDEREALLRAGGVV